MKAARTPDGTGGNPKIGVPVTHLRPFFQPLHCVPCLTPTTLPPRPISPVSPPEASVKNATPPCDDNFRASVVLPTLSALALSEGSILSRARELNRPIPKPHPLPRPPPILHPPLTVHKSRFASPNPFQVLSNDPFPPDPEHPSQFTSPFCLDVPHLPLPPPTLVAANPPHPSSSPPPTVSSPASLQGGTTSPCPPHPNTHFACTTSHSPLIADSGCTGLLLKFSTFPALQPFFTPKHLPRIPFTLPDRSVLLVGGPDHLTGTLSFPHKASSVPVYFLPDLSLSHSLIGISPLLRPTGRAIFTPTSVSVFDTPTSPIPFLTGASQKPFV